MIRYTDIVEYIKIKLPTFEWHKMNFGIINKLSFLCMHERKETTKRVNTHVLAKSTRLSCREMAGVRICFATEADSVENLLRKTHIDELV